MQGKKVVRSLQGCLDAAAAQSAAPETPLDPSEGLRHSFNNPTWSPEPTSVQHPPCSSSQAPSSSCTEGGPSVWETLQGPWDPSPSWWFSPLESNFEQGQAYQALPSLPSYNTEAESVEPQSASSRTLHPALSEALFQEQPAIPSQHPSHGPLPRMSSQTGMSHHGHQVWQMKNPSDGRCNGSWNDPAPASGPQITQMIQTAASGPQIAQMLQTAVNLLLWQTPGRAPPACRAATMARRGS